jgi:tRNA 2-selenouridine synthase
MSLSITEFLSLREARPLIDVRSEGEFLAGHIAGAINIPLLNNTERIAVGTDYKLKGKTEAIKTGFRLVGPRLEEIVSEALKITGNKRALVYCWRGGMRSRNFCGFLQMAGTASDLLTGGYKAYRQFATSYYEQRFPFIVIGGKTGSGKSEILRGLEAAGEQVVDLERLANHKGSAFGGLMHGSQPTTEQFQNEIFEQLLRINPARPVWIEDESIAIGKVFLPTIFWQQKNESPVIEIEMDKSERINRLVSEYGPADRTEFLGAMEKITKKLGGQNFILAKELLLQGDMHRTIEILLTYYDKNYGASLEKKKKQIVANVPWSGQTLSEIVPELIAAGKQLMQRGLLHSVSQHAG